MKRLASILLAITLSVAAVAQTLPNDYAARFAEVSSAYAKHPDNVEALYNMALFYFDNSHPMRDLAQAMTYARRAEERHIFLLEKNKIRELTRLGRKGIDLTSLRQLKQAVAAAARNAVAIRTDMSLAEIDAYLEAFDGDADLMRQLRQLRIRRVYDEAVAMGTPEAWYRFSQDYPGTAEASRMEDRLREAAPSLFAGATTDAAVDAVTARFPQSAAMAQEGERYKSRMAFAEASEQGTREAYLRYLNRFPTSHESQQARERLDALTAVDFNRRTTALELANFADSNSDLSLADDALERLRALIYDNHDIEAARLYIRRYPLDPHYNAVYGRYYSWVSAEGNGAPLQLFADANPGFPYPHALEGDLDMAEGIDTVLLNVPYNESLRLRYSDYVRQFMGKGIAMVPLQRMLQVPLANRNYAAALERVREFEICFDNQWQPQYESLMRLLATPNAGRALRRELADTLSLLYPVFHPADGSLYYTRLLPDGRHSVCRAVKQGNVWRPAGTVTFTNTEADLVLFGFSPDGRMLLGSGGDIWMAEHDNDVQGSPDAWRISDLPPYPVNTDYVETDACFLPDGSGLLLASDRPGGHNLQPSGSNFHGDTALATDLWMIPYSNGHWGSPVNLGFGVNSAYCERSPLMSRNMKTLYFVSDGHGGLGYGDVMVAERTSSDSWTSWSTPRNAGREINSPLREGSLSFGPDESRLYLSAETYKPFAEPLSQIFSFAAWHNGTVPYSACRLGVEGLESYLFRVRVADLERQTITQAVDYSGNTSNVIVNVANQGPQVVLADAGTLFVPAVAIDASQRQGVNLQGYTLRQLVASDKSLPLVAVGFADSTADLLPVARLQLDQLASFLRQQADAVVEFSVDVSGGDTPACYRLSLQRGDVLRDYLAASGIEPSRVIISAYGNVRVGLAGTDGVAIRFRD